MYLKALEIVVLILNRPAESLTDGIGCFLTNNRNLNKAAAYNIRVNNYNTIKDAVTY